MRKIRWTVLLVVLVLVGWSIVDFVNASSDSVERTDYFTQWESLYVPDSEDPTQNGFRDMIVAMGGAAIYHGDDLHHVAWQDFPTHERTRGWFENVWIPRCKRFGIDPYAKAPYADYGRLEIFLQRNGVAEERLTLVPDAADKTLPLPQRIEAYTTYLRTCPWDAASHPEVVQYLEKWNPLLDLWATSVRKPYYYSYFYPRNTLATTSVGEIQADRCLARDTQLRGMMRLATAASCETQRVSLIHQAIDDIETLLIVGRRHYQRMPMPLMRLVGCSMETQGCEMIHRLLREGNANVESLERLQNMLESLPPMPNLDVALQSEEFQALDFVQTMMLDEVSDECEQVLGGVSADRVKFLLHTKPSDWPLVRERMHNHFVSLREMALLVDPQELRRKVSEWNDALKKRTQVENGSGERWQSLLAIRFSQKSCVEKISDLYLTLFNPAIEAMRTAIDRCDGELRHAIVDVAAERYRLTERSRGNDSNLQTIQTLIDAGFLKQIPVDPTTGQPMELDAE